ncbi:MAG: hypothetical protein ABIX10_00150 [Acidimicrobiales bacterium]
MAATSTFLWGLKRSGTHLLVNWLFANHGGTVTDALRSEGLHPKLDDGFTDPGAQVAFYNNCGRFHCRQLELGDLQPRDFEQAARRHVAAIFSIEDCALRFASRVPHGSDVANVLVLRDPLNHLASRLEAGKAHPDQFRVDEPFIDVLASYCTEFLGRSAHLPNKTVVSYNRFIEDRSYRDAIAAELGLTNLDAVSTVSAYGGGSSFSGLGSPSSTSALMNRFRQHPIPTEILEMLLDRAEILEACRTVFGFDLAERAGVA